jgi:putative spermidine/putrescine transport system substrate-binding protein
MTKKALKTALCAAVVLAMSLSPAAASDMASMSWDDIVSQAKKEGKVNWFVWYLKDELRAAMKGFEKKYGIKVIIPEGTESANRDKLQAEKERKTGDIDVMALGWDRVEEYNLSDLFIKIDALLPDTARRFQEINGIKGEGYAFAYWGNQTGIAYDPTRVDGAKLPHTPEEFATFWKAHPGKFGFNYEKGGSGPSFYQNCLRKMSTVDFYDGKTSPEKLAGLKAGLDFFNNYAKNYVITASNADSITRVSDGELWMVPAWEDHLAGLQKRGEARKDIKLYIPSMGMNGGGNGVLVPKNAPRKAAALVFIDWLTSAETQSMFNRDFGTAPMHAKADDAYALVPNEQRKNRVPSPTQPFRKSMETYFIENVILNR